MIPVTKSFIPPSEEYFNYVKRTFDNEWLTNRGELVLELEEKITKKLELKDSKVLCVSNGTVPLQIALKILGGNGEIITTPFSYVATTSSIVWENCTPIFVDIEPNSLTIDPSKIEEKITQNTTCILATHVFGNPCDIEVIDEIAKKNNIKVVYDAAHCFGVEYKGKSIFEYGDVSTCSFHATKIFHSGEGGAIFCRDKILFNKLKRAHNFGHNGPEKYEGVGINGKMSELHAGIGLCVMDFFEDIKYWRKKAIETYNSLINSPFVKTIKIREDCEWNYSYYPILFENEDDLLLVLDSLNTRDIFPRRYFYPSLNTLDYVENQKCEISEDISSRILCLPLFYGIKKEEIVEIVDVINYQMQGII